MKTNIKLRNYEITKNGYTLMELVISISIFMIFISFAAGAYVSLAKANGRANEGQKLYREVRSVFDSFASEIKSGTLDFGCIQGSGDIDCLENEGTAVKKVLAVQHSANWRNLYKFDAANKKILFMEQKGSAGTWEDFTTPNLPVEKLSFDFFPTDEGSAFLWQPTVTITLQTKGYSFKTTYVTRNYGK